MGKVGVLYELPVTITSSKYPLVGLDKKLGVSTPPSALAPLVLDNWVASK